MLVVNEHTRLTIIMRYAKILAKIFELRQEMSYIGSRSTGEGLNSLARNSPVEVQGESVLG